MARRLNISNAEWEAMQARMDEEVGIELIPNAFGQVPFTDPALAPMDAELVDPVLDPILQEEREDDWMRDIHLHDSLMGNLIQLGRSYAEEQGIDLGIFDRVNFNQSALSGLWNEVQFQHENPIPPQEEASPPPVVESPNPIQVASVEAEQSPVVTQSSTQAATGVDLGTVEGLDILPSTEHLQELAASVVSSLSPTNVAAFGGGTMLRGAGGRFGGVSR